MRAVYFCLGIELTVIDGHLEGKLHSSDLIFPMWLHAVIFTLLVAGAIVMELSRR